MRLHRRLLPVLLALVATAALGTACTVGSSGDTGNAGGGSIQKIDALQGATITVGSKEFDEQLLLGQIAIVALQATGANPVDKTNITGTSNVRQALTTGAIDLYWEYTGTAWVSFLNETKPIPDPQAQYDAVKKGDAANGIVWWARSPANDTYAITANSAAATKYNVKSLSDYAKLAQTDPAAASTCVGSEFKSRDDGFPGVQKAYGFTLPESSFHVVNDSIVYPSVGKGDPCNFGSVAATDGRITSNNLTVLDDDKAFFPVYNPAISIRAAVAQQYPQLEKVFASVADKLTTATLLDLNKKVSVDGQKPATVARDWLKSAGFIG